MTTPALSEPVVVSVVREFKKSEIDVVRATLSEFAGRSLADIRVWMPKSSDGVLVPTPKGLTIDRALLPQLEEAMHARRVAAHDPTLTAAADAR